MVLQGAFAKIGDLLNLKVFFWNPQRTGDPEKIENPQKIARKVDFSEPRFTMHLVCTLLRNIKKFGGTPPGVRPVCPGDTSHLSSDMSRLSRGHSVPLVLIYTNQAQMSHVSLGRPEFVPGTPPGHPTAKFLYVIFLYRFFSLHAERPSPEPLLKKEAHSAVLGGREFW